MRRKLQVATLVLTWAWAAIAIVLLVAVLWLRLAGWHLEVVSSASMQPAIPRDSLAITSPVDPREIELGDVIVYQTQGGSQVMHRVVEIIPQGDLLRFRTQGDLNEDADPGLVHQDSILRQSRWTFAGFGTLARAMSMPQGLPWLLGIPMILFLLSAALKTPDSEAGPGPSAALGNEQVTVSS